MATIEDIQALAAEEKIIVKDAISLIQRLTAHIAQQKAQLEAAAPVQEAIDKIATEKRASVDALTAAMGTAMASQKALKF